ncbi:MAG: ABC transporter permease [Pseudomonadota bacterium]
MIKVEPRLESSLAWTIGAFALAILAGFLVSGLLVAASGADVLKAFTALFQGAFGSLKAITASLVKATPLILTGLATVVAFRAQIWNIGQEGQLYAGAMAAYLGSLVLAGMPSAIQIPGIVLFGLAGGVVLGGLAAVLKTRFRVSEIISTVMLNYLVVYLLSYLLAGGPWTEIGETVSYHQSPPIPEAAHLPLLISGSKLHIGFLFAIAAAILCYLLLEKTPLGFEIRARGYNPTALRARGSNVPRTIFLVLAISGAIAALGGVSELFGVGHRLRGDYLFGLGYTGIIIGMIGGLRPGGTVLAGLFFGGLESGALYMKILSGVPSALVPAMEGIVLLFVLIAGVIARFRFVRVTADG